MNTELSGIVVTFIITLLVAWPLGKYIATVFGSTVPGKGIIGRFEKFIFRISGVDATKSMDWKQFLSAMLTINMLWLVYAFFMLLFQDKLPLNPDGNPAQTPDLAFNTAISFLVNCDL